MAYPDSCIRGIPNTNCLTEENTLASRNLFQFHRANADGWLEESINWNDDINAIRFTLEQKKDVGDECKFGIGIAILVRNEIDLIIRKRGISDRLQYERKPIQEPPNAYHGNLLIKNDIPKQLKESIRSQLAWISEIHFRDEYSVVENPHPLALIRVKKILCSLCPLWLKKFFGQSNSMR
jgi:hypothetical protein